MPEPIPYSDLETKGFVVLPAAFGPEEVSALVRDFEGGAAPSSYPHGFKLVARRALDVARPRIASILGEVRAATSLEVDVVNFLTVSHYITTKLAEKTSYLHQDFDLDYRLTGDHVGYLNFWIPILKPERARSNVCVVPFDRLKERSSDAYARLHGSGGHRLVPRDGRTPVYGNYGKVLEGEATPEFELDFDIEELVETPEVTVGDALVMRGDLVHRTQDSDTLRIAASLRATASNKRIPRQRVPVPDPARADPGDAIHALIHRCFDALGGAEVTIGELERFANGGK